MRDFKTQLADATNLCCLCSHEFDEDNPCCCDDGLFETPNGKLHTDGVCVQCCTSVHGEQWSPSIQHDRGE